MDGWERRARGAGDLQLARASGSFPHCLAAEYQDNEIAEGEID